MARPVEAFAAVPFETRRFEDLGALAAIPLETRRFEDLGGYLFGCGYFRTTVKWLLIGGFGQIFKVHESRSTRGYRPVGAITGV